jgi:hypothetical protein
MPVKVHNKVSGQVEEVSGAMAQHGLADGSMALADDRITISRGGQLGSVSADDIGQALGQGFEIKDEGEAQAIRERNDAMSTMGQVQGGVEAALAGATIGGSDWAAVNMLGADREGMAARREGLGSMGTVIETAGALAPLLLSGGAAAPAIGARGAASLGARGLGMGVRALGAPVRGVEALGALAERGALGLVGESALARTVVPMGVRGATEGLAYGVGAEISEATLGGREITAERLMAAGGMGMALGGLAGGGFGLAGGQLGKIGFGSKAAPTEGMARVMARYVDGTVDSTHPMVKAYAGIVGMSPDDVVRGYRKLQSGEMADYFYRADDKADEIRTAVFGDVNGFKSALGDAIRVTSGDRKMRKLRDMIPDSADARAPMRIAQDVEDLSRSLEQKIAENEFANHGLYEQIALNEAKKILSKAQVDTLNVKNGVEAFRIAEVAKQQLGAYTRKLSDMHKRAPTPRMQATLELLEGSADYPGFGTVLRDFLTDERLFGPAAVAQKAIAGADARALTLAKQHGKGGGPVGKLFRGDADFTSRDAMLLVKRWGRAGNESIEESTSSVFEAQLDALQKRLDHYDLSPEEVATIKKAQKHYESLQSSMEKQRQHVDTYDLAQRFRQAEGQGSPSITAMSTLGPTVATIAGSSLGPIGAAAGAVLGSITRPYTMLRTLSGIQDIAAKAGLRIDGAVQSFIGNFKQKVQPLASRTLPKPKEIGIGRKVATKAGLAAMSADKREEHLDEVRKRAAMLAASPAALAEALADMTYDVDSAAPGVAGSMQQITQRGAAYLAAKAPKAYVQPWSGRPPVVSRVEKSAYARRVEAVVHPIETLEQRLADGTLTSEHVEALKEVWPEIHEGVRSSIGQAVVQAQVDGVPISARDRTVLGRLFEVPIGPGADVTMAATQEVYGAQPAESPQQPSPQGKPRARKIDLQRNYMTQGARAERGLED